ncbi:MAG: FAD-binding oxidoreductase [Dehalococcoidia bacterium]|nr:FAD-binding oxidoreductase [Dehalococcoidia bacterium]MSQ34648.1 FAD-binding oxidoreductase [Dehalococcoidia bacterium]
MADRRSVWAWGMESREPSHEHLRDAARNLSARYGLSLEAAKPTKSGSLSLRRPRLSIPKALGTLCSTDTYDRAFHAYGHSFRDRVRKFRGQYPNPPDAVAYPREEADVTTLLDWCSSKGYAAIPFGGGSSVVGGVEPPEGYSGIVTIDMARMDRVIEIDKTSRAARIQAGALGPQIESQLKPDGLTLRHFPQSFEFSTLGGWIATRSAGHYATNHTHIDDFLESARMITPAGAWETFRLPGSGAGPSADRLVLGSEGILGVITEAWVRVQAAPRHRAAASVMFRSLTSASDAARAIAQAKLWPANCRVLDEGESQAAAGMDGGHALLVIAFESADVPQVDLMRQAIAIARDAGGRVDESDIMLAGGEKDQAGRPGPASIWRQSFIDMPYTWNTLLGLGLINDTFETAITWDRWPDFDHRVRGAVQDALNRVCGGGTVTCRITHVYPDGPAPYYTFTGMGRPGSELEMWAEIKQAAGDAVNSAGGTITHHHAVGRDHRPWYDKERPDLFASALRATKKTLDPRGILNPGVLIDP